MRLKQIAVALYEAYLLVKIHSVKAMAVTISIVQAAPEQLHLIKTTPATVVGKIAAAVVAAR